MPETFEQHLARVRSMVTHVMSVPPSNKDREALRAVLAEYYRLAEGQFTADELIELADLVKRRPVQVARDYYQEEIMESVEKKMKKLLGVTRP